MRRILFISCLTFLSGFYSAPAQNPYIQHYTTSDGLPSNSIYYIFQDSKKFIWFATDAGVVKYDGTAFTNFRKREGLSDNEVIRMKEDAEGRIWFMNFNGTVDYFYQSKIYNRLNMPFLDSLKGTSFFRDYCEGADKTVVFYNNHYEILVIDHNKHVTRYDLNSKFRDQPNPGQLCYLSNSPDGGYLLWGGNGIYHMKKLSEKPTRVFIYNGVENIFPADNKDYYLNIPDRGLFLFNGTSISASIQLPFKVPYSIIKVKSVMKDNEGFLWIVTFDEGTFCMKNDRVIHHFDIQEGQAIIQDNENNIWISSMNSGIYKINPNILKHQHLSVSSFQNRGVTTLFSDPDDGIWFTNGKQLYLMKNGKVRLFNAEIPLNSLNLIFKINDLLIAGEKGFKLFLFDGIRSDKFLPDISCKPTIICRLENESSKCLKKFSTNSAHDLLASYGGFNILLFRPQKQLKPIMDLNISKKIFNVFFNLRDELVINSCENFILRNDSVVPFEELSFLNNKVITNYLVLNKKVELFNVENDSIYLKRDQEIVNLTQVIGLPVELQIRNITYDDPVLYFTTFRNIYKIDNLLPVFEKKPVRLQILDINFRNIQDIVVRNDSLYIASDDGLTVIPEKIIDEIPPHTPIPYIQSILVNDHEADISKNEIIIGGSAKAKFTFSCINYSSSPVVFSYMLAGIDKEWTMGTARSIVYQDLPKGDYVFKMRVRKPTGAWSNPVEYHIQVKAVFWRHPLFFTALLLILTAIIVISVIRRKNAQIRRREIDHQLVTLEQKALQSMMNPHFIFNSLGSIQNYLLQKRTGEAGLYLSQFARLIRQNLNAINTAMINLEEEVDRLKNYLDLEKMRLGDKFEYLIEIDDDIEPDEVYIPSMIIQPFAENSIWHGITPLEEKGLINIKFQKESEISLRIIVEDNGIGMKQSEGYSAKSESHLHLGMEMTRKRLDLLGKKFNVPTRIEYCDMFPGKPNPGTRVILIVPFTYSENVS
ncbi:MAG: histidine kinase [Bacteroidetes bacterium]|nr:histidine kinase [Bacteroidota bacterium]